MRALRFFSLHSVSKRLSQVELWVSLGYNLFLNNMLINGLYVDFA